MKKSIKLIILILLLFIGLILLTGCSTENSITANNTIIENIENLNIDYKDAESIEKDLNDGIDVKGKIVKFIVSEYAPDSVLGYNAHSGKHLNFISKNDLNLKSNDEIIGKVISTSKFLGSWVINYDILKINPTEKGVSEEKNIDIVNETKTENVIEEVINSTESTEIKETTKINNNNNNTEETQKSITSSNSQTNMSQVNTSTIQNSDLVWIPQSGTKYHSKSSCSKMKNPTQVTRATAESRGYTACKKCY